MRRSSVFLHTRLGILQYSLFELRPQSLQKPRCCIIHGANNFGAARLSGDGKFMKSRLRRVLSCISPRRKLKTMTLPPFSRSSKKIRAFTPDSRQKQREQPSATNGNSLPLAY